MKGFLSVCLAVSVLGFTDLLTRLHSGFQTGLSESSFCLSNPYGCGQDLRLLSSAVRPIPPHHLKLALTSFSITIHDLENFFAGLIEGLQVQDASPNACSQDFSTASYALAQLLAVVLNVHDFDVFQIVTVGCAFIPAVMLPYETDCNFNALLSALEHTTFETLFLNYVGNSCDINEAIDAIMHCSEDYQYCGAGVGTIIREEINWAI